MVIDSTSREMMAVTYLSGLSGSILDLLLGLLLVGIFHQHGVCHFFVLVCLSVSFHFRLHISTPFPPPYPVLLSSHYTLHTPITPFNSIFSSAVRIYTLGFFLLRGKGD
jgi:hypothetical protein